LDELGNLSLAGQMKLLRVLQTGEFERLGSSTTRKVDVRIISATNADLRAEIAAGRFREDLYFRLNVIELSIPSLSERWEDIEPLARHFLSAHSGERHFSLSAAAIQALEQHDWPGNVRELDNRLQRAVLVSQGGELTPSDLGLDAARSPGSTPPKARGSSPPPAVREGATADPERKTLEAALLRADGVVSRAAAELGLSRQALYRRMERLGIELERRPKGA
jgi:DNA-binding NtrC family response regulator